MRTVARNRSFTTKSMINAITKIQNKLTNIFSTLKTTQRAIKPAKKTANGFLNKSFIA